MRAFALLLSLSSVGVATASARQVVVMDQARLANLNAQMATVALAPLAQVEIQRTVALDMQHAIAMAGPSVTITTANDRAVPPAAWQQGDPADSIYRAARDALTAGRNREATELFRVLRSRFPKSSYVNEAYYWEAVALQRQGGSSNLRLATQRLDRQQQLLTSLMKSGGTERQRQQLNDSRSLEARIKGQLAGMGDAAAAADVAVIADQATVVDVSPTAVTVTTPRPPKAPRAPRPPKPGKWDSSECDNGDDGVQIQALNAVLQMSSERAVPILQKVMARRDSGSVCLRRRAVFLLAQHSGPQTTSTLLNIVRNDPDREVRENAVFWLSQVNDERAVSALDSIVRSNADDEVKEKAIFALAQQSSPKANDALRAFALQESAPEELRERAIFWLGQKGDDGGNSAFLRELYGKVSSAELKERIMFGIAQSSDAGAKTWLLGIAKSPKEPIENRKRALFWLGQNNDAISSTELAQLYREMDDREMREQLLFVLSQRSDRAAVDQLISIAKTDKDPELRKRAIFWLGQNNDPRATQAIEQILTGEK